MNSRDWDVDLPGTRDEPQQAVPRPPARPEAVLAGLDSDDWQVREASCRVAASQGIDQAAVPLEGLLADPDPRVRSAAALALGAVGRERAARALNGLLMDPDTVLASAAEDALEQIAARLDRPDLRPGTDY
ncbi:MAG TPA: HEAT repeat domain-containing protein [Citricoccus sp.]